MTLVLRWKAAELPFKLRWRGPTQQMLDAVARQPSVPVAAIIGPVGASGSGGGGGLSDGDKGDIIVGGGGTTLNFDPSVITAFARTFLNDADAGSVRTTLELGSAAQAAIGDFAPAAHTHVIANVTDLQAALDGKEPGIVAGTVVQYWRGDKSWQTLDKAAIGLGNVTNTSDAGKPVSTAQQAALDLKAPLASPALTGAPSGPTAAAGTNSTQLATTAFVQAALALMIGAAPAALDTLSEIADALADDPNFAATITTALAGKQPLDATLTALAALAGGADKLPYFTGADVLALADLTAFGRTLAGLVDAAALRTVISFGATARAETEAELVAGANITITPSGVGAARQLTFASTGGGGGGGLSGTATVTVPAPGRFEWTETVAAPGVLATDRVGVFLAGVDDAEENDPEMLDHITLAALPGNDVITFELTFGGPESGPIKLHWKVL